LNKYEFLTEAAPLLVQVELTEACNLKCKFCYNSQEPKYNEKILETLEVLASQGVMQVNLTGGEPLAHPQFFEILDRACELFPHVVLLTNGSLMNDEVLEKIHLTDLTSVNISIHGNREIHDDLTQIEGSYEASLKAVKYFIEKNKILVSSNYVLNNYNFSYLDSMINDLREIGLEYMTITRFIPVGIGKQAQELVLSNNQLLEAFRLVHKHLLSKEKPHIEFAEATPACAIPEELCYLANCCSYGYDRFYVDVYGNLLVCGLSRIELGGNIFEKSIVDIKKNSAVFESFINNQHIPEVCYDCKDFKSCHGGCRASAMKDGEWEGTRDSHMTRY